MFKNRLKKVLGLTQNEKGMSLIEIMIVLGIIAAVMATVMNFVFNTGDKAKAKQTKAEIDRMVAMVKFYKDEKGEYPTTDQGLEAIVDAGFMEEVPRDAWNNDFSYESPGSHGKKYEICSDGADEDDESDDICNFKNNNDDNG